MTIAEEFYKNLIEDPDLEIGEHQTREEAAQIEADYRMRQHLNNVRALSLANEPLKAETNINKLLKYLSTDSGLIQKFIQSSQPEDKPVQGYQAANQYGHLQNPWAKLFGSDVYKNLPESGQKFMDWLKSVDLENKNADDFDRHISSQKLLNFVASMMSSPNFHTESAKEGFWGELANHIVSEKNPLKLSSKQQKNLSYQATNIDPDGKHLGSAGKAYLGDPKTTQTQKPISVLEHVNQALDSSGRDEFNNHLKDFVPKLLMSDDKFKSKVLSHDTSSVGEYLKKLNSYATDAADALGKEKHRELLTKLAYSAQDDLHKVLFESIDAGDLDEPGWEKLSLEERNKNRRSSGKAILGGWYQDLTMVGGQMFGDDHPFANMRYLPPRSTNTELEKFLKGQPTIIDTIKKNQEEINKGKEQEEANSQGVGAGDAPSVGAPVKPTDKLGWMKTPHVVHGSWGHIKHKGTEHEYVKGQGGYMGTTTLDAHQLAVRMGICNSLGQLNVLGHALLDKAYDSNWFSNKNGWFDKTSGKVVIKMSGIESLLRDFAGLDPADPAVFQMDPDIASALIGETFVKEHLEKLPEDWDWDQVTTWQANELNGGVPEGGAPAVPLPGEEELVGDISEELDKPIRPLVGTPEEITARLKADFRSLQFGVQTYAKILDIPSAEAQDFIKDKIKATLKSAFHKDLPYFTVNPTDVLRDVHQMFKDEDFKNIADLHKVFEEAAEDPDSILSAAQVGKISERIKAGNLIPEGIGLMFATPPILGNDEYKPIPTDWDGVKNRTEELAENLQNSIYKAIEANGGEMPSRDSSLWKNLIVQDFHDLNTFVTAAIEDGHNPESIANSIQDNLSKGAVNILQADFHKDLGFKPSAGKSTTHQESELWQKSKSNLTEALNRIGTAEMRGQQIDQDLVSDLESAVRDHLNLFQDDPTTQYPSNLSGEVYQTLHDVLGDANEDISGLIGELHSQLEESIDGYTLNRHEESRAKLQSLLNHFEEGNYTSDEMQASPQFENLANTVREHLKNVQDMNLTAVDGLIHDPTNDTFTVNGGEFDGQEWPNPASYYLHQQGISDIQSLLSNNLSMDLSNSMLDYMGVDEGLLDPQTDNPVTKNLASHNSSINALNSSFENNVNNPQEFQQHWNDAHPDSKPDLEALGGVTPNQIMNDHNMGATEPTIDIDNVEPMSEQYIGEVQAKVQMPPGALPQGALTPQTPDDEGEAEPVTPPTEEPAVTEPPSEEPVTEEPAPEPTSVSGLMEKHNDVIEHMYERDYGKDNAVLSLEKFKANMAKKFEGMGAEEAEDVLAKEHLKMKQTQEKQATAQAAEDEKQRAKDEAAKAKQEATDLKAKEKWANGFPGKPGDMEALARSMDDGEISEEVANFHALNAVAHLKKYRDYMTPEKLQDLKQVLQETKQYGADFDYIRSEMERLGDDFGSVDHISSERKKLSRNADYAKNYKDIVSGEGDSAVLAREAAFLNGAHNKFTEFEENGDAKHDVHLKTEEGKLKDFEDHTPQEVSSGKTKRHPETGEAFGDHHVLQSLDPQQEKAVGELKQAQSDVSEAQEKVDSLSGQLGTKWKAATEELEAAQQNLQKAEQNAEEVGVPKELISQAEDDKPKQGPPDPEVARRKMLEGYVWHEETRHWIKKENLMALRGGMGANDGILISGSHEGFAMDEQGNASNKNFLFHGSGNLFQVGDGQKAPGGIANHSNVVANHIQNKVANSGHLAYHGRKEAAGTYDKGITPIRNFNLPGIKPTQETGKALKEPASFMDQFKGGFGLFKAEDISDLETFLMKYNSADHLKDTNHVDDLLEYLHDFEEQLEREKKENSDNKSIIR